MGLIFHLDQGQHAAHLVIDLLFGTFFDLQPERDVFAHGQVREQRITLKNRIDLAFIGRDVRDVLAVQIHAAAVGPLEAGQDSQQGGLAAPAGAQEGEEFAFVDG